MKTKIKRHSRSVISVLLAVCMLVSCMTVGLIATDAAKITNDEAVGATYYLLGGTQQNPSEWGGNKQSTSMTFTITPANVGQSSRATFEAGKNYYVGLSSSTSYTNMYSQSGSSYIGTKSGAVSSAYAQSFGNYRFAMFSLSAEVSSVTVTVTATTTSTTYSFSAASGSSELPTNLDLCVVGTANLTGKDWDPTVTSNKMSYDSAGKYYTKSYENISSGTIEFKIAKDGAWTTTYGYTNSGQNAAKVDEAGIVTTFRLKQQSDGGDPNNNIHMETSQNANIEVRWDGTRITVLVTPSVSTVTAGTCTGGSVTVNGGSSATNIAYEGEVTLRATAAQYYHFKNWDANAKLVIANSQLATTTASVKGTTTVTATFEKDNYTVSKGSGDFTITTPAAANTSVQWGDSVSVIATTDNAHYVDYLYYLNNNTGDEVKITDGEAGSGRTAILSGSFDMPTNNVTVYAHVHAREVKAFTYGVCTDSGSAGHGYVNAGECYNDTTDVTHTIDSPGSVIEGTKVNFAARPAEGYKFVGWYSDAAGNTPISGMDDQDETVTSPTGDYYAKFESLSITDKVRVYVPDSMKNHYVWYWGAGTNASTDIGDYNSKKVSELYTPVNISGTTYYYYDYTTTSIGTNNFTLRLSPNSADSSGNQNTFSANGTYTITSTTTNDSGAPAVVYYPIKFVVTNPDKGTAYAPLFGKKSTAVTFNHTPTDDSNWKTSRSAANFTEAALDNDKTTATTTSRTMPATYAAATPPTFTVTFVEKDYYKVTFSAGAGGTIRATAGGTAITSGTMVKEGTQVVFTAAPDTENGYTVAGWTGSGDLDNATTSTSATRTVNTLTQATDTRVYFSKDRGTASTGTYFGWFTDSNYPTDGSGDSGNPQKFSVGNAYVVNGRTYGYIDTISDRDKFFFIAAFTANASTDKDKCQKMYYQSDSARSDDGNIWYTTDFSSAFTDMDRVWYKSYYDSKNCWNYYIRFKVSSDVIGVIVDLGEAKSNGDTTVTDNCYRLIPVFNKDVNKVTVYAKDGTYRGEDTEEKKYDYFPAKANTVISSTTGVSNIAQHTNMDTAVAVKGSTVTVTTTITDSTAANKFYVRGFSFNGVTPTLLTPTENNVYTSSYTIPADFEDDYLEITPIYNFKSGVSGVTTIDFYIENYDEAFQNTGWGNQLAVYPYYSTADGDVNRKDNAFGGYPGQPVINYGGRRFVQIATTFNTETNSEKDSSTYDVGAAATIKGITLSNFYFDRVHRQYCREVDTHLQTYDYDDFYKIYRETTDEMEVNATDTNGRKKTADQITFAFKYRTSKDNFGTTRYSGAFTKDSTTVTDLPSSITKADFTNGWDDLLDYHDRPIDIFGKQLTTEEQTLEPLLVVSNGYEYTHAGYYATTWTVYTPDGATKIGTITPSALIIANNTRLVNNTIYPDSAGRGGDYPQMMQLDDTNSVSVYNTLKATYANRPVLITYEEALSNASGDYHKDWSEVSTRSDGRWYYSYMNEAIHADLKIEYRNSTETDEYLTDNFTTGTTNVKGKVTGATVKFLDTTKSTGNPATYALNGYYNTLDYTADTNVEILSNQNDLYRFLAGDGSGYIFEGWFMERDGIATPVNPSDMTNEEGASGMTSNATFVARYVKNPSGKLTINHTVADSSVGDADTYITVVASKTGTSPVTLVTDAVDTFTIDSDYVSYKSGYTFEITLKTVRKTKFDVFSHFSAGDEDSSAYLSSTVNTPDSETSTTSFTVDVDDLFAIENNFPTQSFDTLTYYSNLNLEEIHYQLIYKYTSKLYGEQKYYVKGLFTPEELNKYVVWDDELRTDDGKDGWFRFKSDKQAEFLANKCPYEKNIRETLSWDYTNMTNNPINYYFNAKEFKVTMNASQENITTRRAQFILPCYAKITNDGCVFYSTDSQNRVVELSENDPSKITVTEKGIQVIYNRYLNVHTNFGSVYAMNGASAEDPHYVTAPEKIYSSDYSAVKHFQYWSVQTVPADVNAQSVVTSDTDAYRQYEIARCYNVGFNLSLYQDYIVIPVYGTSVSTREHEDSASITFVENGRNQWESLDTNEETGGANIPKDSWKYFGDRILSNFMVGFDRVDKLLLRDASSSTYQTGVVVEKLDTIQNANQKFGEDATWTTQSEKWYNEKYGNIAGMEEAEEYIKDNFPVASSQYENSNIPLTSLDNKNRIEFTKVIANQSQTTHYQNTGRKNYVYRAFAYMREPDGKGGYKVTLSKPVYYTYYDIAMIENGSTQSQLG